MYRSIVIRRTSQITTRHPIALKPKVLWYLLPHGYSEAHISVNSKSDFILTSDRKK